MLQCLLIQTPPPPPLLAALKSSRAAQERRHILGTAMRRDELLDLVFLLSLLGVTCGMLSARGEWDSDPGHISTQSL